MAPVVANAGILDRVSSVFNNSNSKQIEREENQGVKCQSSVVAADRPALVPNYGAPTEELVPASRSEELVPVSRSEDGASAGRSIGQAIALSSSRTARTSKPTSRLISSKERDNMKRRPNSIYKQGEKYPHPSILYTNIKQSKRLKYTVEPQFHNAAFFLVREGFLEQQEMRTLRAVSSHFRDMVDQVPKLMQVDFSPLLQPRVDYSTQNEISMERVEMMSACLVYYGLNYGLVVRYLGGEYTGEWRDVDGILKLVRPVASQEDYDHIERILKEGCPADFDYEESHENKMAFIERGNQSTVARHRKEVNATLNKEERNSHVIPFFSWTVVFSAYGHHVPQAMLIKPGKKPRLIWNGTLKRFGHEVAMNDITPTENEAPITFGYILMTFMIWLYNLRITFPNEEILLAFMDITACFRWPRINPDLVGAFGFVVGSLYFAANAMVFGSVASASSWEPFRRVIELLAVAFFAKKSLVDKHRDLLDMIQWDEAPPANTIFTHAAPCRLNKGIEDEAGNLRSTPHFIWVDDNLIADTRSRMKFSLAAGIESIFSVLGWPFIVLRQCALSIEKWKQLIICHQLVLLGLLFNTREMTVSITDEYRAEVLELMEKTWHDDRGAFTVPEIEKLIGKLGRIGQAFRPIYLLMPHLYSSVAYALRENGSYLIRTSAEFRSLVKRAKEPALGPAVANAEQDLREIRFAIRQVAKEQHSCKERYTMPVSLKQELQMIKQVLRDGSIKLSTPLAHIVPRHHNFVTACDACKFGGGGWSTDLAYIWDLQFPQDIVDRAHLKNNKRGKLVSINSLEFLCVIVNMAAAICALAQGIPCNDPYPVLLNLCDNVSACAWVNFRCKESLIGRRLALVFVGLLMKSNLGIQAEWISTTVNVIADDISRLKKHSPDSSFDYSTLRKKYPLQLGVCRKFVPSEALLSMLYGVMRTKESPDPLTISQWQPEMLGKFISSSS